MSILDAGSQEFTETYVAEDPVLATARARAGEIGITPVEPDTGAALRLLAALVDARALVEVGTGTGVSGLWLLRGARPDAILTTMDVEPEHQRLARQAFADAGHAPSRTRVITGRALDVLPRLADGGYDLLFLDADKADYAQCVPEALRLLRTGGVLVINSALFAGRVADPTARDPESIALREVVKALRDAEEWTVGILPTGDGLLAAVKRPSPTTP